jgi:hypothetical protein
MVPFSFPQFLLKSRVMQKYISPFFDGRSAPVSDALFGVSPPHPASSFILAQMDPASLVTQGSGFKVDLKGFKVI